MSKLTANDVALLQKLIVGKERANNGQDKWLVDVTQGYQGKLFIAFKNELVSALPWLLITIPFNPSKLAPLYRRGSSRFRTDCNTG